MTDLKVVMDAIDRIESGEALTEEHYAAIKPMFAILKDKLRPKDRVTFKHVDGGYLIGSVMYPNWDGLAYNQRLLQCGSLSSTELWSGGSLSKYGLVFQPDFEVYEPNWADVSKKSGLPYQTANSQKVMDFETVRKMLLRINELSKKPSTPERKKTKQFLEREISRYKFKNKIKSFDDENEKARKAVQKAIKYAITKLIETPETRDIGLHLHDTIKTGLVCEYTGDWKWEF